KDKTSVNADLYIDDSPANIQRFQEEQKNYIIYDNSTNRSCDGPRARNWDEVYDMVMEAMKSKSRT
ncbi:MAG: 5'-nucleotidase, partial [Phycisphaeraceae bacterium]|nr:5'-nucleotidase [Phycisphaeraceae bacterium]